MMSIEEVIFRAAKADWEKAKQEWQAALAKVNVEKDVWEKAQATFFGTSNVMSSAEGCGTTGGCGGCKGCAKGATV
jgi:hypothetical protein